MPTLFLLLSGPVKSLGEAAMRNVSLQARVAWELTHPLVLF